MNRKVSIVTYYPLEPFHPRTEMIFNLLKSMGFEVSIHNPYLKRTFLQNLLLKITLGYFDFVGAKRIIPKITNDHLVIIQGLIYLPLSKKLHKKKIPVIYETLDNNVHLYYYYLSQKYRILNKTRYILRFFENSEKSYVRKYVNATIVNSKALLQYFNNRSRLIYYSSPLEKISNQSQDSIALLYLGTFEKMKGAFEILKFVEQYNLPLLIAGTIYEADVLTAVNQIPGISHLKRVSSDKLQFTLSEYTQKYFLFGLSLTQEVNLSNKTQELNKDIDYLAMGIPIIGNSREPTAEKINAGCGVFYNDYEKIHELLDDKKKRKNLSVNCKIYYEKYYSKSIFENQFKESINTLLKIVV